MDNKIYANQFSKSVLSGLLSVLIIAVLALVYTIIYREKANVAGFRIIMPLTIFIGFPVLDAVAGYGYFLLRRYIPSGKKWFSFLCVALMFGLIGLTIFYTASSSNTIFSGVRGLLIGLELITFLVTAICIPYFARHPEAYE